MHGFMGRRGGCHGNTSNKKNVNTYGHICRRPVWSFEGPVPRLDVPTRRGSSPGSRTRTRYPWPGSGPMLASRSKEMICPFRTRSEEPTSEPQPIIRISYADYCLKTKNTPTQTQHQTQ